ncbi:MAG: PAS domain-containing protein, partial [Myxococcota bacterium]
MDHVDSTDAGSHSGLIDAIHRSQAVIEFLLDGTILTANQNFLNAMGYALEEVQGEHHRIFVEAGYARSAEYRAFWEKLAQGHYHSGEFKRLSKSRREVWIQASYNPVLDSSGRPHKIVKFATDITEQKLKTSNTEGQIDAIHRSQAVIEFEVDGTILTANENFLNAMGYSLQEVQGRHHRIFVEEEFARGPEYRAFWEKLAQGHYHSGEFKRLSKSGQEVWIQASYNPILDSDGRPIKVIKFAS